MRRGGLFAAGSVVIMLTLASPLLGVKFAGVDPSDMPGDVSSGKVAHSLQSDFASPPTGPLQIVVDAPANASLDGYRQAVSGVNGVQVVSEARRLGDRHWEIDAVVTSPEGDVGARTVRAVQALPTSYPTTYTGQTADLLAQRDTIANTLPIAAIVLVLVTLILLFVFTGSIVLPIQALLLNALSVGAAFGILVWAFQDGHLEGFLGFADVAALEQTSPILLFALAFGLSTDYNLFLLGRVKEARDSGLDDRTAVAIGIDRTGRMVTSAAILFCIAVGALMFSRITLMQELGFGTTLAVLLDATIIRALLVPSLMGLLGSAAWWAPKFLRRLHSALKLDRLESGTPETPAAEPDKELASAGR
jgi:RND superfamily putative drug exporter